MEFKEKEKYKNKFGIYCIMNCISGDVYVGQTAHSFYKRFLHHQWKLRNNSHDNQHLQRAFNIYGEDLFTFIPVRVVEDASLLDDLEIQFINFYRKINHCYNIIEGGNTSRRGLHLSEETKRKIGEKNRINMTGRKASEETKRRMSKSRKGKIYNKPTQMKLNPEMAFEIKTRLVQGQSASKIAKTMRIDYKLINNIVSNNSWYTVHVDGWDDFLANRKTYHRLTKQDHREIYRLHIEEGKTKEELAEIYQRTSEMMRKIIKEQNKIHNSEDDNT